MTSTLTRRRPWLASGSGRGRRRTASKRYRVEYRLGGRESKTRYGGSFKTQQREAIAPQACIAGELAALRVPDLGCSRARSGARRSPRPRNAGRPPASTSPRRPGRSTGPRSTGRCRSSATAASTRSPRRTSPTSSPTCTTTGKARESIRKTVDRRGDGARPRRRRRRTRPATGGRQAAARRAGRAEPADRRARRGRLPAAAVQAPAGAPVPRLVRAPASPPSTSRWSATTTSRAAGSGCGRRRRRRGGRCGSSCTRCSPTRSRRACGPREDRDPERGCSPTRAPTRSGRRSRRRARRPGSRCSARTTYATAGSRCCTCAACRGRGSASSSASATWP